MNRERFNLIALLAIPAAAFLLTTCKNAFAPVEAADGPGVTVPKGVVSLRIHPISPVVFGVLGSHAPSSGRALAPARAYLSAQRVHVRLDGTSGPVEWEEEIDTDLITATQIQGETVFVSDRTVDPGIYSAEVQVYGNAADPEPVVGGATEPFAVVANQTTSVVVTCVPNNPVVLDEGVPSLPVQLAEPWQVTVDEEGVMTGVAAGSEQWYMVALDESSPYTRVTVTPTEGSQACVSVFVYDAYGELLTCGGSWDPGMAVYVEGPTPAGTYYIGVIVAELNGQPSDGPFVVMVERIAAPALSDVVITENPYFYPSSASLGDTVTLVVEVDNHLAVAGGWAYPRNDVSGDVIEAVQLQYNDDYHALTGTLTIGQYYPASISYGQITLYDADWNSRTFWPGDDGYPTANSLPITGTTPDTTGPQFVSLEFSQLTAVVGETVFVYAVFEDPETGIKQNWGTSIRVSDTGGSWEEELSWHYDSTMGRYSGDFEVTDAFPAGVVVAYLWAKNGVGIVSQLYEGLDFASPVLTIGSE